MDCNQVKRLFYVGNHMSKSFYLLLYRIKIYLEMFHIRLTFNSKRWQKGIVDQEDEEKTSKEAT